MATVVQLLPSVEVEIVYVFGHAHWLNVIVALVTARLDPRSTCHHSLFWNRLLQRVFVVPSFPNWGAKFAFSELDALAGLPAAFSVTPPEVVIVISVVLVASALPALSQDRYLTVVVCATLKLAV